MKGFYYFIIWLIYFSREPTNYCLITSFGEDDSSNTSVKLMYMLDKENRVFNMDDDKEEELKHLEEDGCEENDDEKYLIVEGIIEIL